MRVLVVYAHPSPNSFNHALLESFNKGLKEGGHSIEIIDLYTLDFDPCLKLEDLVQFTGGEMPKEVIEQQEKVSQAEALAFVYPIMNLGQPAILKGWIDRVFSAGFAYGDEENTGEVKGLLTHKKVLFINTTGGNDEIYESTGAGEAIKTIDKTNFNIVYGIQNVEHAFFHSVLTDAEARTKYLDTAYHLGKEY